MPSFSTVRADDHLCQRNDARALPQVRRSLQPDPTVRQLRQAKLRAQHITIAMYQGVSKARAPGHCIVQEEHFIWSQPGRFAARCRHRAGHNPELGHLQQVTWVSMRTYTWASCFHSTAALRQGYADHLLHGALKVQQVFKTCHLFGTIAEHMDAETPTGVPHLVVESFHRQGPGCT